MCAIASYELLIRLREHGYRSARFVVGNFGNEDILDGHAWVEWRGYGIDITATQFGHFGRVYVERMKQKRNLLPMWTGSYAVGQVTREWYQQTDWKTYFRTHKAIRLLKRV